MNKLEGSELVKGIFDRLDSISKLFALDDCENSITMYIERGIWKLFSVLDEE